MSESAVSTGLVGGHGVVRHAGSERQRVGARGDVERVQTVAVGRGAQRHGGAGSVGAGQRDRDGREARFTGVLHTVAVEVLPDEVGDRRVGEQSGIDGVERRTRPHGDRGGETGRVDVRIGGVGRGGDLLGREGGCDRGGDLHGVGARRDRERVRATGRRGGRRRHRIAGVVGPGQFDGDTIEPGLTGVLHTVGVEVVPDPIADGGREHDAGVEVVDHGARHDGDGARAAGRVDVGVGGGHAHTGERERSRGGGRDLHLVVTGLETGEGVVAAAVGRGGRDRRAAAVEQVDRDAADPGLTDVLHPIGIEVVPDTVADRAAEPHQRVEVGRITGGERDRVGRTGRVGVGVDRVAPDVLRRERRSDRRVEDDRVRAWHQPGERVVAAAVGRGGGDRRADVVEEATR